MRIWTPVKHYRRVQRMSENLKNTLGGPNTPVDNRRSLLKKPTYVRATEERSRRDQRVCGQLWNTTNTTEGTNARADNRRTMKNESMRARATAYHFRNPRLCDRDRIIIILILMSLCLSYAHELWLISKSN
jgi:hypothetical protein